MKFNLKCIILCIYYMLIKKAPHLVLLVYITITQYTTLMNLSMIVATTLIMLKLSLHVTLMIVFLFSGWAIQSLAAMAPAESCCVASCVCKRKERTNCDDNL